MSKRLSITVHGLVQGVFFRTSARAKAHDLGLTGWVRNDSSGTVSIVAEGPEERLKEFLDWCYTGPRWAKVEKVEFSWGEATGEYAAFSVS